MALFDVEFRSTPSSPIGGLTYGTLALVRWADQTADIALAQYDRLNEQLGVQPYYYLLRGTAAEIAGGLSIQVACLVDGVEEPDANLGGELFFEAATLEFPAGPAPADTQQAAVSAVHNLTCRSVGHYSWNLQRDANGSRIIHLDVEAVG